MTPLPEMECTKELCCALQNIFTTARRVCVFNMSGFIAGMDGKTSVGSVVVAAGVIFFIGMEVAFVFVVVVAVCCAPVDVVVAILCCTCGVGVGEEEIFSVSVPKRDCTTKIKVTTIFITTRNRELSKSIYPVYAIGTVGSLVMQL